MFMKRLPTMSATSACGKTARPPTAFSDERMMIR